MGAESYLLLGPEVGEKKEFIGKLIGRISEAGNPPEVKRIYPGEKDLGEILGEMETGSLFSDHRVYILEQVDEYSRAAQVNPLAEMLKNPPEGVTLILTSDKNSVDRKISSAVDKDKSRIFWEMFEGAKKNWIQAFFRQRKINIHQDALEELLDMVENNTSEMKTACETLVFYFSEGSLITAEDIDRILYHSKEENVFTLFDKIVLRDLEGALDVYCKIRLSTSVDVAGLFSGMLWQIRLLLSLSVMRDQGYRDQECFRQLKLTSKKRQKLYWGALSRYRTPELQEAVSLIARYDREARSIRKEMQDRVMEIFLYKLIRRNSD